MSRSHDESWGRSPENTLFLSLKRLFLLVHHYRGLGVLFCVKFLHFSMLSKVTHSMNWSITIQTRQFCKSGGPSTRYAQLARSSRVRPGTRYFVYSVSRSKGYRDAPRIDGSSLDSSHNAISILSCRMQGSYSETKRYSGISSVLKVWDGTMIAIVLSETLNGLGQTREGRDCRAAG